MDGVKVEAGRCLKVPRDWAAAKDEPRAAHETRPVLFLGRGIALLGIHKAEAELNKAEAGLQTRLREKEKPWIGIHGRRQSRGRARDVEGLAIVYSGR